MTDKTPSKISSTMSNITGTIKEKVGHILGNENMEAQGVAQKLEANAEYDLSKAKDYTMSAEDKLSTAKDDLSKAQDHVQTAKESLNYSIKSKDDDSIEEDIVEVEKITEIPEGDKLSMSQVLE